jgi:hypothetical protein
MTISSTRTNGEDVTTMPLDEAYFVWLYSQVGSVDLKNKAKTYWKLLALLHEKEFTWTDEFEKDGNRAQDGKDLRREFLGSSGVKPEGDFLEYGCSFLELLMALAFKLAFQSEVELKDWFWILIDNLGLLECTDANPPKKNIVYHILDKVIARDYAGNGAGGLFPLQDAQEDQRSVELWYQGEAYLLERL